jgi:hypothetical protein
MAGMTFHTRSGIEKNKKHFEKYQKWVKIYLIHKEGAKP